MYCGVVMSDMSDQCQKELQYFIFLQMFGSGHIKSPLWPNPQQEGFQMHSVMCQANLSIV